MYFFTINGEPTVPSKGSGSRINYESLEQFKDYLQYDKSGNPVLSDKGVYLLDQNKICSSSIANDSTLMSPLLQVGSSIFQYLNVEICLDTMEWFSEGRPYEIGIHKKLKNNNSMAIQYTELWYGFHKNTYQCTDLFGMHFERLSLEAPLIMDFQTTECGILLKRIIYTFDDENIHDCLSIGPNYSSSQIDNVTSNMDKLRSILMENCISENLETCLFNESLRETYHPQYKLEAQSSIHNDMHSLAQMFEDYQVEHSSFDQGSEIDIYQYDEMDYGFECDKENYYSENISLDTIIPCSKEYTEQHTQNSVSGITKRINLLSI